MTPWTVAPQAPLSMGLSQQERLLFPPPGDLPDPGIEPESPVLAGEFFTTEPPGKLPPTPPRVILTSKDSIYMEGKKYIYTHIHIHIYVYMYFSSAHYTVLNIPFWLGRDCSPLG